MEAIKLAGNVSASIFYAFMRKLWPKAKKSVKGEIALVTGAGHGLGRMIATRLAALGATVIVVDINEDNNNETAAMITANGLAEVYSFTCDLSSKENIKRLAKEVKREVGDVTMLVNNAGVVFYKGFMERTDKQILTTFNVNILAHFWMIREFLPAMEEKNHGHIIAVSSLAGYLGAPYLTDYCATKHAIMGMMDSLHRELRWNGKTGVITTCASPSFVKTGFVKNPTSGSQLMCPILEPEQVVDEIMHGLLTDHHRVEIPSSASLMLMKALFPDSVIELFFDYMRPTCEPATKDD